MDMRISTKGRYALRMLLDLAEHGNDDFVALKDVAERQGISKNYLEQIIALLKNADVLKTARGFQGGYKLSRTPDLYTVGAILRLTEGSLAPVACVEDDEACNRSDGCMTLKVWQGLSKVIADYLDGITLQDILDEHHKQDGGQYYI
jgi:Rrf2 family protein